jgi:hypothetical protein
MPIMRMTLKAATPATYGVASLRTFDFSLSLLNTISKACWVISSMDRFITSKGIKETGDFLGNQGIHDVVKNIIETNEIICLYGDSGVGKTHLVTYLMKGRNWVDLGYDLIKSLEFMDRLKVSDCHVVIDDLENDSHLIKDIFETIRTGGKLSKGSLIIVARNLNKVDFCNGVYFDHIDVPTMVTIGRKSFPKEPLRRLEFLAEESKGNVRNFLYSIQFSDKRDIFKTPRDFISDLLCEGSNVNPLEYFGKSIPEHGYIWDIVHENYVDSKNPDLIFMSECMSQSDILDTEIYKGNWSLIPLFSTISTVMPAFQINHSLNRTTLRSGSAWTKFGNFKMRDMKVRSMSNRCGYVMDFDSSMMIKMYCQRDKEKALELCKTYKLGSSDMDVINHLAIVNKMKPKELQSIKKSLKALAAA